LALTIEHICYVCKRQREFFRLLDGPFGGRLNLLNKAAQRAQYAALLKKLNLPIEILMAEIVFQNSARNFSFLRRDLKSKPL